MTDFIIDITYYANCLELAESLRIYSVKGNLHSQFIGAILRNSKVKYVDSYVFNQYDNIVGENKYYLKDEAIGYIRGFLQNFNVKSFEINSIRLNKKYKFKVNGVI